MSTPRDSLDPANDPARALTPERKFGFWGAASLLVVAVAFYVWWGLSFGVWVDNGVYAVVVVLVAFGLSGMWLMMPNPPVPNPPPA